MATDALADSPAPAAAPSLAAWVPRVNPWLIAFSVMLATVMEVLDTAVANVSLPQIAGSLAVTTHEATWVLTSYLVANAIVLPMTGWLGSVFGRKRFLISCIFLFTMASAACGAAPSMAMLVLSRVLQGATGGALQPLAQAILMESFPPRKRGVANAVYGLGVVVAPIVGPTLGGWITDNYSWRWIFFINMPVGALALFMCNSFVEDPPYIRAHARHHGKLRVDMLGFFLLALWLATLQIVLDKGQEDDWLAALWIRWTLVVSAIAFVGFVFWELRAKHPLVELRILKNRNFAVGVVMIAMLGMVLYSTLAMLPLYLQSLMGYTAMGSGMAISPRGFGAILSMILVSQLITRVDARILICFGFGILAYASNMLAGINTQIAMSDIVVPNVIMGMAMGFIFVPLTTLCVGDLSNEQMGNATGIYNLMRNIGGSFGIALITTMLARREQVNQAALCVHMSVFDPAFRLDYQKTTATFSALRGNAVGARAALTALYGTLVSQATLCAYIDCFRFLAGLSLLCIVGAFFFKRLRHAGHSASVH